MITVNMHEAKTRLSELVKAVEERDEVVVLCRDGHEVAEIRRRSKRRRVRDLNPEPRFPAVTNQPNPCRRMNGLRTSDERVVGHLRASRARPR